MTSVTSSLLISEEWLKPIWEALLHSVSQVRRRSAGTEVGLLRPRLSCLRYKLYRLIETILLCMLS